jgi:environmental stress-induced protein Ves
MLVLREAGYLPVPWKNGGGVTREIHREPPAPAEFDWRLSLATIDSAGPFSAFDACERTLILVRGAGVELTFAGHGVRTLTRAGDLVTFDGAWRTDCKLLNGPSSDLNLIVSRHRAQATARCAAIAQPQSIRTQLGSVTLVCCITGSLRLINSAAEVSELDAVDVAQCFPGDGNITCSSHGPEVAWAFIASIVRRP